MQRSVLTPLRSGGRGSGVRADPSSGRQDAPRRPDVRDSRRDDVGLADGFDDLPDAGPALRNEAEVAGVKVEHRAVVFDQPQMASMMTMNSSTG